MQKKQSKNSRENIGKIQKIQQDKSEKKEYSDKKNFWEDLWQENYLGSWTNSMTKNTGAD